jgi:hypothetical protein
MYQTDGNYDGIKHRLEALVGMFIHALAKGFMRSYVVFFDLKDSIFENSYQKLPEK